MPKNLAWTQQQRWINVTITSTVLVYAPAEREDTLHLYLLYPFLLCVLSPLSLLWVVVVLTAEHATWFSHTFLPRSLRGQIIRSRIHERTTSLRFWAYSWEFSDLRFPYTMFTLQTSYIPILLNLLVVVTLNSERETLKTFVPVTSKNSASLSLHYDKCVQCTICVQSVWFVYGMKKTKKSMEEHVSIWFWLLLTRFMVSL